jgi:hypothetical protein
MGYSDEDLIAALNDSKALEDDPESDEEEEINESEEKVTWAEAAASLTTFIDFSEQAGYMSAHEIMNLNLIQNDFCKERFKSQKQKDIRDFFILLYHNLKFQKV